MDNLLEELIQYEDLIRLRENLNKELFNLSGKTSQDSIARINEIGRELNEVSSKISSYDKDKLDKINKYFATDKEFRRISGELKTMKIYLKTIKKKE